MRRAALLLGFLLAPLLASCALNPPRIVSITPSREVTDVATNQTISITFDRSMSHDSVERRFELAPSMAGCAGSRQCRFAWSGNTFMFLHPGVNFALQTEYTVSMHAGYADESGQRNTLDHAWHFTTEKAPALSSTDPADVATAVSPDRNLMLSFNRAMRPDSMRTAVQLKPDTPFVLRSRPGGDGSQYEVVPTSVLQPNQTYTVTVDHPTDLHGNPINARLQIHFKTGSLSLLRKIGYLIGQRGQPAFGVGIVDPHPDPFLQRSTPKQIYSLGAQSQITDGLLAFDWAPDGQRLAVVDAPRDASSGPIQIVKLAFRRLTGSGPELWVYDLTASGTAAYRRIVALDVTTSAWLNDNSTLVAATGTGANASLYRVNIFSAGEAGGVVKVTGGKDAPNGSTPNTPAYDRRIAFAAEVDGLPQIFVMNGDGCRPQQLTLWESDYPN